MKRVFFTESQVRRILKEFKDGDKASVTDVENGVTTDPPITSFEPDKKHDVPFTTDKNQRARKHKSWFGAQASPNNGIPAYIAPVPPLSESEEYDNTRVHGKVNQSVRRNFLPSNPKGAAGEHFKDELWSNNGDEKPKLSTLMMRKHRAEQGIGPDAGNKAYVDALDDAIEQAKGTNAGMHAGKPKKNTNSTVKMPDTGESFEGKKCEDGNNIYYF